MKRQLVEMEDFKNGPEMAQTIFLDTPKRSERSSKSHQDYWRDRLTHRAYKNRNGRSVEMPEWQVRIAHKGRREWFNLGTANRAAAAVKARDIYLSIVGGGWETAQDRYKPPMQVKPEFCTLGEFIADVQARSHLKPVTIRRYVVKLRKLVADLTKIEASMTPAELRRKNDSYYGGCKIWAAKVDAQRLSVLSPEALARWRNAYVAKADIDPIKRKSAERTAASTLRGARSLFTTDILRVLQVKLPGSPFAGVKLKDPGPQRYHSDVNPEWLLMCADRELRQAEPQQYLALFLCLWAGLRRKEADLLTWKQVNLKEGQIQVRRTVHFEPKTEESQRDIDLSQEAVDVLRSFMQASCSEFVLDGFDPNPGATYEYYRCDITWRWLHKWLRAKGIQDKKAIHSLRKESGSLIAASYGIEAARQHLGHRDIRTTSCHYVEKKKRVEVRLPLSFGPSALPPKDDCPAGRPS